MLSQMTIDDQQVLDVFLGELRNVIVNKSGLGEARKKPLLLLLVLAMIKSGELRESRILFEDVEKRLSELIIEYGGRTTKSGAKPEQPFFHLRTSPFWELTVVASLPTNNNKKTVARKVLSAPGTFAQLRPSICDLVRRSSAARDEIVDTILRRWWTVDEAARLRSELGL